jgi:hypothetical protein
MRRQEFKSGQSPLMLYGECGMDEDGTSIDTSFGRLKREFMHLRLAASREYRDRWGSGEIDGEIAEIQHKLKNQ